VWHVDKYKITFKLVINLTNEILKHTVVSSGLSRPRTRPRPGGWETLFYAKWGRGWVRHNTTVV